MKMSAIPPKMEKLAFWFKQQRFLLLNSLVVFLCFFLLPGIMIFKGIEAIADRQFERVQNERKQALQNRLAELATFSANERFSHYLLFSTCRKLDGSPKRYDEAVSTINRLKKFFPETFSFVIADKKGKIIPEASDEKSFLYLFSKAFSLIKELEIVAAKQLPASSIPDIDNKLKRLRPFLGNLLREEDLLLPFKKRESGSSLLISGAEKKFHLWYGTGENFMIMAFINRNFIRGSRGMEYGAKLLQKKFPSMVIGYSSYPPLESELRRDFNSADSARIIRAIAESEDIRFETFENSDKYVATRMLDINMRGFAFFRESGLKSDFTRKISSAAFRFLLSLSLLGYVSVKLKIIAFFSYAVILPLLVMGSLTDQYIKQYEIELIEKVKKDSQRTVEKIDAAYNWYKKDLEGRIVKSLDEFGQFGLKNALKSESVLELHRTIKGIAGHDEFILVDNNNIDYMKDISSRVMANSYLVKQLCAGTVEAMLESSAMALHRKRQYFTMIANAYILDGQITYLGASELDLNIMFKMLIDKNLQQGLFPLIVWREETLNKRFIESRIKDFTQKDLKLLVFCKESETFCFSEKDRPTDLKPFIQRASDRKKLQNSEITIDGRRFLTTAMPGQNLRKLVFAALFPTEIVEEKIASTRRLALLATSLMIFLAMATFFLLSHLIFKPLNELKSGIDSFSTKCFHNRLEIVCNNELGKLSQAFNESFETLQDLEVARIVQDSLFPEPYFQLGRVEVQARTQIATKLGGDYFDIQKLEDESVLVFLGDATGHGIPAALSMAMAKSTLIFENQAGLNQTDFMGRIHRLYHNLRKQGSRDFMTCFCLQINAKTCNAEMVNFGHPYPFLLKPGKNETILLSEIKGMPPGFGKSREIKPQKVQLETGDTLIFYTDGFVEAANSNGESLGFERFEKIICSAQDDELSRFIENVFKALEKWEPKAADDRTIIAVRIS
jgi:methyl-accepting chemotaxis protein